MVEESSSPARPFYHLADGVILCIGPFQTQLVDLERDIEVPVDFRMLQALESLSMGSTLEGYEEHIEALLSEGLVTTGKPTADAVLRRHIQFLDELFIAHYRPRLSATEARVYELLLEAHCLRKRFLERVGQCAVLPETALRRCLQVGDAARVGRKKVLCLGDDDLMCVGLSALGHDVLVYDIDDYLIEFIRWVSGELHLDIQVQEQDLRDPISEDLRETFDVFLTDPMSNRDCFEIFLSRGLALLKPDGVGYTAVFAPECGLFETISKEMRFDIRAWWRRHNRYYSKYLKLHTYESDWVEVRKTPETAPKIQPQDFCTPLNLYREDHLQRQKNVLMLFDELDDPRRAMPLYLGMTLDALAHLSGFEFLDEVQHLAQDWSVLHRPTREGYITLQMDRVRNQLMVNMFPYDPALEGRLRQLLMAGFKSNAKRAVVAKTRDTLDLRLQS